jgi:enediyne polyketide synthase
VHALQACVPHRRLLPVGCERFTRVAGTSAPREIFATERHAANGEYVWDVLGLDRFGKRTIRWVGLRLRDVGPLAVDQPWQPSLLAVYLERSALALGLQPDLRIVIGERDRHNHGADRSPVSDPLNRTCRSYQNGMVLQVSAPCRMACDWEPVEQRSDEEWRQLTGPRFDPLLEQLRTMLAEPIATVAARIWTAVECLSKADYTPSASIVFGGVYDGGWVMLRAGSATIASTVVSVVGLDVPVAIALLTTESNADHRA